MPGSTEEILAILDLTQVDVDVFEGGHPATTRLTKVYGGQLVGQAAVAASRTVEPDRLVHALQATFLDVGRHGEPVRIAVDRVRDGRSFSSRSVTVDQGGRPVLRLMASFQPRERGLEHHLPMPSAPAPVDAHPLHEVMGAHSSLSGEDWRAEWGGLEIRYVTEHLPARAGRAPGVQQLWIKVRDPLPDDPALHRNVIGYLSDLTLLSASLLPHGMLFGADDLPRATLNHHVWFHEDARADDWLLVDQRSPWAGGARGLSFASVYSAQGRPVASLAQEGLIRPLRDLRHQLGLDLPR